MDRLRKSTGDNRYTAPLDRKQEPLARMILVSCYRPFGKLSYRPCPGLGFNDYYAELFFFDRMNMLLDIWSAIFRNAIHKLTHTWLLSRTALLFGILYLTFQAYPSIFVKYGFTLEQTGMAFIGIGFGMICGCAFNIALILYAISHLHHHNTLTSYTLYRYARRHSGGVPHPPEFQLLAGKFGAVIVPASLFWLAFTTYKQVHWIVPILASTFFGAGFMLCFNGTFTYLVLAYRPMAASALAANTFVRSAFAAAFPLFAGQMFNSLGTVGATALLAGVMMLTVPLP